MTLDELGLKYGTDKASHGHDYLRHYERAIQQAFPDQNHGVGSLLELGWWDGASMRMWREHLPYWNITGLDVEPKQPIEGVNFIWGSQDDHYTAQSVGAHGPFDIIVDDASHLSPLTIKSFELYWPHLKPGGLYIVEDLQVSYHSDWMGHPNPLRPGKGGTTIMQFLKGLTDSVHEGHAGIHQLPQPKYDVSHMEFRPGTCMIWKGGVGA